MCECVRDSFRAAPGIPMPTSHVPTSHVPTSHVPTTPESTLCDTWPIATERPDVRGASHCSSWTGRHSWVRSWRCCVPGHLRSRPRQVHGGLKIPDLSDPRWSADSRSQTPHGLQIPDPRSQTVCRHAARVSAGVHAHSPPA